MSQAFGGIPGIGTVIMRGLYTGSQQTTTTTASYLGDTPMTASGSLALSTLTTLDPDLVDVERVEVLKGPQGTLFGASSLGGLIRIIPREPDLEGGFGGSVRLGLSQVDGGSSGHGARVSLNMPLSSRFGLLVSAVDREDGGATRNIQTGHDDLGSAKVRGGSLTALAQLSPDWKATLRLLTQDIDALGGQTQDNVQGTGTPVTGERQFSAATDAPSRVRYRLAELASEYTLAAGTLTASLSQARSSAFIQADYTNTLGTLLAGALAPGFSVIGDLRPSIERKNTFELRFASKRLGTFESLAGVFYTDENNRYDTRITTFLADGSVAPPPFGNVLTSPSASTYREHAVFVNGTYYFSDDIDVGAGVRYARNTQHGELMSTGLLGQPAPLLLDFSDDSTTYQLTGRWRLGRELSVFARYATGYRPGGPQTNPNPPPGTPTTFQADTVANLEFGIKGTALDRHLSYDASVYRIDWKDVQLNGLANGLVLLGNAGRAQIDGFEAQVQYATDGGVTLGANLGYNDARLTEIGTSTAAFLGARVGDRLPGSSRVTAALFGDWRFALGGNLTGSLGTTVRYQGDKPSSYPNSPLNPSYTMPAYTTLDLRAGLEWDRYTLRLGVDNVTDKLGYTGYTTARFVPTQTTLPSGANLTRPRTVSVSFGVDF
ncbi:MAG: TonB-dependent receptor domain-containing protein [Luteimonas sp.]